MKLKDVFIVKDFIIFNVSISEIMH